MGRTVPVHYLVNGEEQVWISKHWPTAKQILEKAGAAAGVHEAQHWKLIRTKPKPELSHTLQNTVKVQEGEEYITQYIGPVGVA